MHQTVYNIGAKPTGTLKMQDADALYSKLLPENSSERIVIVGGGLAGIQLAQSLDHKRFQIALIDKNPVYTFQPLRFKQYPEANYSGSLNISYDELFEKKKNLHFIQTEALYFNPVENSLVTRAGKVTYSKLIITGGYAPAVLESGGGVTSFFCSPTGHRIDPGRLLQYIVICMQAERNDFVACAKYNNIVVVGGGRAGVEIASELAEIKNRFVTPDPVVDLQLMNITITLVESGARLLPCLPEKAGLKARRALEDLGVEVRLNTRAMNYSENKICFEDFKFMSTYACIWTNRSSTKLISGVPLHAVTKDGKIRTDPFGRVEGLKNVFAVGSVAGSANPGESSYNSPGLQDYKTQADMLARNLNIADSHNWKRISKQASGAAISLGWNKAVVDVNAFVLTGVIAKIVWFFRFIKIIPGWRNKYLFFIYRIRTRLHYSRYFNFLVSKPSVFRSFFTPFRYAALPFIFLFYWIKRAWF